MCKLFGVLGNANNRISDVSVGQWCIVLGVFLFILLLQLETVVCLTLGVHQPY